jgi:hypothetical protein
MEGKRGKRLDSSQCLTKMTRQRLQKSLEVADAVKHSMAKFVLPTTALSGLTAESGSGTPESFANACKKIEIWGEGATEDSCRLHDL